MCIFYSLIRTTPGLLIALTIMFGGLQHGLSTNNFFMGIMVTPVYAGTPEAGLNTDEKKSVKYSVGSILRMSPRKIRELSEIERSGTTIFINGFSTHMSHALIYLLTKDVEFSKKLLRDMRNAKSAKKRKGTLKSRERELTKELEKLNEEVEKARKKMNTRGNIPKYLREWITLKNLQETASDKLKFVKSWLDDLGEGP